LPDRQPGQATLVAQRFDRLRHPSGADRRVPRATLGGWTPAPGVLGGELQVQPQLLLEVAIVAART
jgi:hypothetical protein